MPKMILRTLSLIPAGHPFRRAAVPIIHGRAENGGHYYAAVNTLFVRDFSRWGLARALQNARWYSCTATVNDVRAMEHVVPLHEDLLPKEMPDGTIRYLSGEPFAT